MIKLIIDRIINRPLISLGIILLTLSLSFFLGILNLIYYSFDNEQSIVASRHYGDIVITTFLNQSEFEIKGKSKEEIALIDQFTNNERPTFIDTMGFSKPAFYSSSEYAATCIPYKSKILPYLQSCEWYESSIGRHLRAEWFSSGGSILVIDEGKNNIMIGNISGVDFSELLTFDYSFQGYNLDPSSLPEHGIFLSEALYELTVQELGREIEYGEKLKIGYPSSAIDNPRLASYFYIEFVGVIPDTGGRLNTGTEARSDVLSAYIDPVSMVRLFQLDKTFSPSANGDRVTLKKLPKNSEDLKFLRLKQTNGYLYDPNQIAIRVKKGTDVDATIKELQFFLDENVNSLNSSGEYKALSSYEYLGYGAISVSADEYISILKEKINLVSLVIVIGAVVILVELLYDLYVSEKQIIIFIRTLGASRFKVWKCYIIQLSLCFLLPFIIGFIGGTIAGFKVSNSFVGISICSPWQVLLLILIFAMILVLVALLMTLIITRRDQSIKGGDGLW